MTDRLKEAAALLDAALMAAQAEGIDEDAIARATENVYEKLHVIQVQRKQERLLRVRPSSTRP